jgi:hypothetical protein
VNIEGTVSAGSLMIRKPDREPEGCVEVDNPSGDPARICQKKEPDLACVGQSVNGGAPVNVTLKGCVTTFGLGADSFGIDIAMFRERTTMGGAVDPGYDVSGDPGQQADNTPGALVGGTVSTQAAVADCSDRGAYEIANVPTETDLIVRVSHKNVDSELRLYVDTYQYNFRLRNSAIKDQSGAPVTDPSMCATMPCFVTDDVNTIAIATFKTIPRAAGVSSITGEDDLFDGSGQGHIAGEIQDCTSEDTVQNAVVAIDATARKLAYFNVGFDPNEGDIEDPKPSSTRVRTNADGLYAAIGVDTMTGGEPVTVGAAVLPSACGQDDVCRCTDDGQQNPSWTAADAGEGEALVLGSRTVYVFPDSITILTFDRGMYERAN